jgi:hypothetical protein
MCKLSQDILNHIKGHSSPHDILEQYQAGIPDSISRHPVLDQLYISSLDGLYIVKDPYSKDCKAVGYLLVPEED